MRRHLDDKWKKGYSTSKLAKKEHISYVVKYLFKAGSRVRASQNIGNGIPLIDEPPF